MSVHLNFQAASEAAEGWLNTVILVTKFGQSGSVDLAFQLLLPPSLEESHRYTLQDSYLAHAEVLEQMKDTLAAVSDGPVPWELGRGWSGLARVPSACYPHIWSSAHEAAAGIARLALDMLAAPLEGITDPGEQHALAEELLASRWQALAMTTAEVATLQERVRRERAKVLVSAKPEDKGKGDQDQQNNLLPWGGPEWDELAPLTRRLLQYMHGRKQADLTNCTDIAWGKDDVTPGAIYAAISKANKFLGKHKYPGVLSKVRGELIIRWQ